jgi:ABC-type amino acid transport substrate-binding protein
VHDDLHLRIAAGFEPDDDGGCVAVLPADSSCDTVDCLNQPDKTIATVIGTAAQEVIKSLFPKAQEMANRVNNDGFLQVRTRRSHAYLTDNITAQAYLKEHPGAVKIVWSGVDKPFLQAFPAAPALPKGSLHFARWLDIWFQEQIHNGTYERLYIQNIGWAPPLDVLLLQRGGYP